MQTDTPWLSEDTFTYLAEGLVRDGVVVLPHAVPTAQIEAWRARVRALHEAAALRTAHIGRGRQQQIVAQIRNDTIAWIEPDSPEPADAAAHAFAHSLIAPLNRRLFLGLDHAELHYAHYAAGGFYKKHRDRHRDSDARVLTFIVYLNEGWQPHWGGQLRLYHDANEEELLRTVEPEAGTLVLFLSERFPHEVVPAARPRMSLTGWIRRRT